MWPAKGFSAWPLCDLTSFLKSKEKWSWRKTTFLKSRHKIAIENIIVLQEIMKKIVCTWNIRRLVDESFVPATQRIILKIEGFQDLAIGSQDISTPSFKFGAEYYIYFCFTQKQWVWVKWASQFYRKNGPGCKHNLCIDNDGIKALERLLGWMFWPYFQFWIKTTKVKW